MLSSKCGLLFACVVTAAFSHPQCCSTCESGYEKFYSIPNSDDKAGGECGECCLKPSRYQFWKLFEPKLLRGDCATQGYTQYKSTEKDGFGLLSVVNDRYIKESLPPSACPEEWHAVYADMHDGDKKEVTISGNSMTIKPSGNPQTWVVKAQLDRSTCSALIDFNVPGKPSPPPVNLTITFWRSTSDGGSSPSRISKTEFEFTDPSGKLAAKDFPLNRWVELEPSPDKRRLPCPFFEEDFNGIYADMHDGDKKEILRVRNDEFVIKPSGNNQSWDVYAKVDRDTCSASINFRVPGKPRPPPVKLQANFFSTSYFVVRRKGELQFTDPTGTIAAPNIPVNTWVQLSKTTEIVI